MAIKQKVISIQAEDVRSVNQFLDTGWLVKQMISEYVSSKTGGFSENMKGKIVFLLEKDE